MGRGRHGLSLVVASVITASVVVVSAGPAPATYPGPNGKIAVVGDDGDEEIYVMNPNGTNPLKLTNNAVCDRDPSFSGDGKKIVYWTHPCPDFLPDEWEIWIIDADGSDKVQLTDDDFADSDPAISPDGSKIVFERGIDLWIMNADGSGHAPLTVNPNLPDPFGIADVEPTFSPDGTKIAFAKIFSAAGYTPSEQLRDLHHERGRLESGPADQHRRIRSGFATELLTRRLEDRLGANLVQQVGAGEILGHERGRHRATRGHEQRIRRLRSHLSPNGAKIVYQSSRVPLANGSLGPAVVLMNPDGSDQTPVPGVSSDKVPSDWGVSTAPTISVLAPADQTYTLASSVRADYSCVDDDDPAPLCRGTVPDGTPIDTSTVGEHVFLVESSDSDGNVSDPVTVTYRVGYDVRLLFPWWHLRG